MEEEEKLLVMFGETIGGNLLKFIFLAIISFQVVYTIHSNPSPFGHEIYVILSHLICFSD